VGGLAQRPGLLKQTRPLNVSPLAHACALGSCADSALDRAFTESKWRKTPQKLPFDLSENRSRSSSSLIRIS
jgi:hypothetical protein